jgi:beta-N-acetylhexosaminidase
MNLREKLGQRLVYALPDQTELTPEVADFLVACRAAGVVLFGFNIKSPAQIARFNADLQDLAARNGLPPFIISLDEEGGAVSRMPGEGSDLIAPSQMAQAVAGLDTLRACAAVTSRRLRRLGFNLNYTPVVDVNNNPANPVIGIRSFGADPELVSQAGVAAVETYLEYKVSPCAKHFPGHGDTNTDSHYSLPVVNKSLAELREFELVPFRRVIEAGVPAIMTAHILYPQVETENLPATLSATFLNGLLRQDMGFDGLIFTDCLDMRAIADRYGLGAAAIMAFRAGADIAMLKGGLAEQRAAFEEVVRAAEAGGFEAAASDATLARLERWRERFALPQIAEPQPSEDVDIIAKAARRGITYELSSSAGDLLPVSQQKMQRPLLLDFTLPMASLVEEGRQASPLLAQELQKVLPNLHRLEIPAWELEVVGRPQELPSAIQQSDFIIAVVRNAKRFATQAAIVNELLGDAETRPVIVVAAREPYDLELFGAASARFAIYGDPPASIKALVATLSGN